MKLNNTVLTLALVGVLALAALAGGLLPMGSLVHAVADPVFVSGTASPSVPENTPPGVNIGVPVSATDADETGADAIEFGNTLTYKLSGTDADKFDIDPSTGQLITKAPLDFENPRGGTGSDSNTYLVTVTVDDGETRDSPITLDVTINVSDEEELPAAPPPPTVVSGEDPDLADTNELSTTTLKVVWHPVVNTGRPQIDGYAVQYKKSTDNSFTDDDHSGTGTTTTIADLDPNTSYHVRVRATNTHGSGPWSLVGTGSTNKAGNSPTSFAQSPPHALSMAENSPPGLSVGAPVTADDRDSRTLSYRFAGRDSDLFDFNTTTGQIRTRRGVTYNHEDPSCGYPGTGGATSCTYYVTVVASDGAGASDALRVAISVTDRTEIPSAPAQPTVRPTANSLTSLDVSWSEPTNTGPAITAYAVEYRRRGSGDSFSTDGVTVTGATATIAGDDTNNTTWLTANTSYEVRVRATSDEGSGGWSPFGTGSTNVGNREPVFSVRREGDPAGTGLTITREVNENTPSGRGIGGPVVADDGDGDARTYKLVATDTTGAAVEAAAKFDINKSSGQIMTKDTLNHEDTACGYVANNDATDPPTATTCIYTVVVEVRDGLDTHGNKEADETTADDAITVAITVEDVIEVPSAPTVILASPQDVTLLGVVWYTNNTGPSILSYDLQYRAGSGTWQTDNCSYTGTDAATDSCNTIAPTDPLAAQIESLTANTSYSVQMRARNAEGTSAWAPAKSQRTNRNKSGTNPNSAPTFGTGAHTLVVDESHERRAQDVGSVLASDDEGGTIRYSLEGRNKNLFTIDSSAMIRTRSGLDFEDPKCVADLSTPTTRCMYPVLVKIDDGQGASISSTFTVYIQDVAEAPSVPSAPRVTATTGSGKKLDVTWSEPGNNGPAIIDYDIQYREVGGSDDAWIPWTHGAASADATADTGDTTTKTTITGLAPRTTYEVEVQAKNDEGTTGWSSAGRGTTNASNLRPSFDDTASLVTLNVDENTRAGQNVGSAVSATDNDGNRLTYTLEGPGKDSFTIVSSSGQIRTRAALDHEERDSYSVTVKVNDGQSKDNSIATKSVTIEVDDVVEPPSAPAAPTVTGVPGSTDSVKVTWEEPANTGADITGYDVQYGVSGTGGFNRWPHEGVDRSTIITGLVSGTRYEVRVRAVNDAGRAGSGIGEYSRSGTGSPNPDVANRNPVFSAGSRSFSVDENTAAGDPIGDPVDATDPDDDPLAYELEGTDAASFDIDSGSGQIRTSAALNHEEKSRYSVTVRARDGRGGTSTAGITITVTDVVEPPGTPLSPTVSTVSSTSVLVSWDAPDNTGPPITDYDYRYMSPSDTTWTEVTNTAVATTSVTIQGLTPSTLYDVEVRATNAEGTSGWSSPGIGSTNAPGANNPPVFSDGASTTRSVSASAPPGTNIGGPIAATDADTDDSVTYSLEGRDAALFDIDPSNGQLRTRTGVTLIVATTYTVVVVADDTKDTARITVSIEATAGPPNNPPVFSAGPRSFTVRASAPAGTAIGTVTATDADSGDTVTYSLAGTNAASFRIGPSNGQITTKAGVTLTAGTTYTVEVVASDTKNETRTTVTINVIDNTAPAFDALFTSRSVAEGQPVGVDVGGPVSATDPDRGDTLTYTLSGPDAASFAIGSRGQISTAAVLDYEAKNLHAVVVTATDSAGESATITVLISVTDVSPPAAPAAPRVIPTAGSTTSLDVSWRAPSSDAPISDYDVQYRAGSAGGFTSWTHDGDGTTAVITGLTDGTSYEVQVRAQNSEGWGDWSASGTGTTTRVNHAPVFGEGATALRFVPEDSPVGTGVGGPVSATDPDGDTLSYTLSGADARSFTIGRSSGQISTAVALDYDTKNSYSVTVTATDTGSLTDTIAVTISVTEVVEDYGCATRGAVTDTSNSGLVADCEALLRARNTLEGSARLNWSEFVPIARWEGVTVSRGRVTEIDLRARGLTGTLPAALGNVDRLTKLNLRSNSLTGTVPASLGNLRYLEVLNLHSNMLNGEIPDLSGTVLQELYLTNNVRWNRDANGERIGRVQGTGLSGSVPAWLNRMTDLRELWLWGNNLSGTMPDLSSMRSLDKLKLNGNTGLTGITAAKLPSRLTWLIASETEVGATMPDLSGMTSLTTLWLNKTGLSGTIPVASIPTSVTSLNLKDNSLSGDIPDLSGLNNLRYLRLHRNDLSGDIPGTMGDMASIQRIWLYENELTGIEAGLANAADTLTHLYLAGNSFRAGTCLPGDLVNVVNNDFAAAGLAACQ